MTITTMTPTILNNVNVNDNDNDEGRERNDSALLKSLRSRGGISMATEPQVRT